jgi:hypothetical protein
MGKLELSVQSDIHKHFTLEKHPFHKPCVDSDLRPSPPTVFPAFDASKQWQMRSKCKKNSSFHTIGAGPAPPPLSSAFPTKVKRLLSWLSSESDEAEIVNPRITKLQEGFVAY